MTGKLLRPRRLRYRVATGSWVPSISRTLPRRVLYGAFFFYAAYCAHLATFWREDADLGAPLPPAETVAASVAPIDSGVLEPALLRLVAGSGMAPVTSAASVTSAAPMTSEAPVTSAAPSRSGT